MPDVRFTSTSFSFPNLLGVFNIKPLAKVFFVRVREVLVKGEGIAISFTLTPELEQKVHCQENILRIRTELLMILFLVTRCVSHCCFIVHFLPTTNYQLPATVFQPSALVKGTKSLGINSRNFHFNFSFFLIFKNKLVE